MQYQTAMDGCYERERERDQWEGIKKNISAPKQKNSAKMHFQKSCRFIGIGFDNQKRNSPF